MNSLSLRIELLTSLLPQEVLYPSAARSRADFVFSDAYWGPRPGFMLTLASRV